jgi:methyl-accepting chemotaxis protein
MAEPWTEGGEPAARRGTRRPLPLGVKVTLGTAGLLGLVLVSSVAAIWVVVGMKDADISLTDRDATYGESVDTAALAAKGVANDERGFLLSGDPMFVDEAHTRIASARRAFDSAATAAADAQQRQAVEQARAGFERWVAAVGVETATYRAGHHQEAIDASLGPTRELRKTYEGSLADARALDDAQQQSAREAIATDSSRSVRFLTLWLGIGLALGAVIAVWLVRTIAVPVARMVTLLASVAAPAE